MMQQIGTIIEIGLNEITWFFQQRQHPNPVASFQAAGTLITKYTCLNLERPTHVGNNNIASDNFS